VLKLSPEGQISMVLGQKDYPGTDHTHFDGPDDVAFGKSGEIYVADGEGNSRVVEFDSDGHFLKEWGRKGAGEGEFHLTPHTIATDAQGLVYVGDRENARIQVFDLEGKFLTQWRDIGHPYGIFVSPDQHIWMAEGGRRSLSGPGDRSQWKSAGQLWDFRPRSGTACWRTCPRCNGSERDLRG